jgi:hypothetical protein
MEKSEAIRSLRDDAGHWFARAAAMRKLAADVSNPEARRKMLAVADNYMRNAREAQARADALVKADG